ncbi:hypothetical protein [Membranihabitans marinus]|uniref:hypothetical protein n=1 Tax=Membranihabitans marinus TaxID=1227546 RepID=UPI001F4306C1|nr:hypothetical protein [Membranihabitans marinus]
MRTCLFGNPPNHIAIYIKSLGSSSPVAGAVIDLNTCNLGKFYSNEDGKVLIPTSDIASCVMYISASGFMSLVKSFAQEHVNSNNEITFFMQRQDKYKMGQLWSAKDQLPISGVEIRYHTSNNPNNYATMSDKAGKFSIIVRKSKPVTLHFYHPDYKYVSKTFKPSQLEKGLGHLFLQPHLPDADIETETAEDVPNTSARKFTYDYTRQDHIIVVEKVRNEEDFKQKRKSIPIHQKRIDNMIWIYTGPYYSKQIAQKELSSIRRVYPDARISTLP